MKIHNFKEFQMNENIDSDILELMNFLDIEIKKVDNTWKPGDETGAYMNYTLKDDTIELNCGWSDYEEGYSSTYLIKLEDKITLTKDSGGHSVMGGDYENSESFTFNNLQELISWLSENL